MTPYIRLSRNLVTGLVPAAIHGATLAIALSAAQPAFAQTVDAPTRAEDSEQRRSEKSEQLVSYMPGKVERLLLAFEQRYLAERIFNPPRGVFARLAGMPEGQGFQAGPAYRYSTDAAALTATSAISLIGAWEVTARLDMPQPGPTASPFWSLGGKFHRLPEEDFYGLGQGTTPQMRTNYLLDETIADVTGGVSPVRWFTLGGTAEYRAERPGSGRDPRSPSIDTVHRAAEVPGARIDLDYVRLGAEARIDAAPAPEGAPVGGRYSVSLHRYIDRSDQQYSFNRWDVDLQQFLPIFTPARLLVLRAQAAGVEPDAGHDVPFYLQPSLGGWHSMRGYHVHRFRDRNAILLQSEYRFMLNDFMTGMVFYDAGKVAFDRDDLWDLADLDDDYGISIQFGFLGRTAIRAEVAFGGDEGTVYGVRFGNVF